MTRLCGGSCCAITLTTRTLQWQSRRLQHWQNDGGTQQQQLQLLPYSVVSPVKSYPDLLFSLPATQDPGTLRRHVQHAVSLHAMCICIAQHPACHMLLFTQVSALICAVCGCAVPKPCGASCCSCTSPGGTSAAAATCNLITTAGGAGGGMYDLASVCRLYSSSNGLGLRTW